MIVVVMGVTGAGKTVVGQRLAAALGVEFIDGDDYHPPENVAKMRAGTPLVDADRWPWLARLNRVLRERAAGGRSTVLACSALKAVYREALLEDLPDARVVHLRGSKPLIASRLAGRRGHYMNAALLNSQFAALEEPADAIVVDIEGTPEAIVAAVTAKLAAGA
ncbi:MAG: gluconokinase [Bacteroidota bacterium]|nr:gluconokinase [Burkholderiales bacterium]